MSLEKSQIFQIQSNQFFPLRYLLRMQSWCLCHLTWYVLGLPIFFDHYKLFKWSTATYPPFFSEKHYFCAYSYTEQNNGIKRHWEYLVILNHIGKLLFRRTSKLSEWLRFCKYSWDCFSTRQHLSDKTNTAGIVYLCVYTRDCFEQLNSK